MSTPTPMPTKIAKHPTEFQDALEEAYQYLTPAGSKRPKFWYRGHDRGIYTLTPSLYRFQEPEEKEATLFDLCAQHVSIEKDYGPSKWARAIWMQHYGIPTRLLDWTRDVSISLFFAVKFLHSSHRTQPTPTDMPCIYVLNPSLLNAMSNVIIRNTNNLSGVPRVPGDVEDFDELFSRTAVNRPKHPLAVIPVDPALNKRLEKQEGCFTVQGEESEPLECQAPHCVFCISLTEDLCETFRNQGTSAHHLFPGDDGIAQVVASKAELTLASYDQGLAKKIRKRLEEHAEQSRHPGSSTKQAKDPNRLFGMCNLGGDYIKRETEGDELATRVDQGPPFIFVTGEAGIGKTNFILQNLLHNAALEKKLWVMLPLRLCECKASAGSGRETTEPGLLARLYEIMIGEGSSAHEQQAAREMVRAGAVVIALDGLDEFARNQGEEAVRTLIFELEALGAGSAHARIIISCRDHIYDRLQDTGSLGRSSEARPIEIKPFDKKIMEATLSSLGPKAVVLAELAQTPLLYQMIRSAEGHLEEMVAASANRTLLQEAWFKAVLGGETMDTLDKLGVIAGEMLKKRSDVLEVGKLDGYLQDLVKKLADPRFPLFIEEEKQATFAFSHQSLREFILAWRVYRELKSGSFPLLASSPSFDYEGGEFHSRVNDLLKIDLTLGEHVIGRLHTLWDDQAGLQRAEWNHLVRNLFEILGELTPAGETVAVPAARVALKYLNPVHGSRHYVSFKTRYNVARCLERIHPSAPRPYVEHTLQHRPNWLKEPFGDNIAGAYAIRGFHLTQQESRPWPPILCEDKSAPEGFEQLEADVSNGLMDAVEKLSAEELPQDAEFLGINCTHALVRWLPRQPNLDRIVKLLEHPHASDHMKQNIFWGLFRRYRSAIPPCFKGKGHFKDCGRLSWYDDKSWACEEAKRVYEELRQADSAMKTACQKV